VDYSEHQLYTFRMHKIQDLNFVWFFSQMGLTQETSFFAELARRVQERWLPPLRGFKDVVLFLEERFESPQDAQLHSLSASLKKDVDFLEPQLFESCHMLLLRVAGLGLDPVIAKKLRDRNDLLDVFLKLGLYTPGDHAVKKELQKVRDVLSHIRGLHAEQGTSVSLSYKLFVIEELLDRLDIIGRLLDEVHKEDFAEVFVEALQKIWTQNQESLRVREFLVLNVERLAYQVTVITSSTGEHYISSDRQQLKQMWWKAIKGAMVVAVLAFLKVLASKMSYPPLLQFFVFGSIYAAGFVVIHLVGGVLATKQPAMTASTIAAGLGNVDETEESFKKVTETIVRLLRTQIAALFGNYIFAFPLAILLVFPFLVGHVPLAAYDKAKIIVEDLHPLWSLSFLYAAIAGVCLFLAGLVAGLADNWFSYQSIASRLQSFIGGDRGQRISRWTKQNFGIITGNVILGFMLGGMSSVGRIIGIPLDIRHVTFASAAFGIGWIHQPERMPWADFAVIALSIFIMGLVNLAVSFSLSLTVAMQSRKLKFSQGRKLVWSVTKHFLRRPQDLFFDPVARRQD
jgi:site-specific recombinase